MEIIILNEESAKVYKENRNHIFISIQDPNKDFIELPSNINRIGYTHLRFSDLDKYIPNERNINQFLFNSAQAETILNLVGFGYSQGIEVVYINCVAGISRSAGVGAALSKIYNNDDSYFFNRYLPNMLVYRTILNTYYGGQS